MYGADVAQLRLLAAQFDRSADQLERGRLAVGNAIRISAWIGPFATTFRVNWDSEHSLRIATAARMLRENAGRARANADEQERASAVDGGLIAGRSGAGSSALPPEGSSAEEVRAWWDSLSEEQQRRLIENDPRLLGNLNGVPLEDRAEANRLTAADRLGEVSDQLDEMGDDPPEVNPLLAVLNPLAYGVQLEARERWLATHAALQEEQSYLRAVTEGRRNLVVYDPGEERIVEMIGTPGPDTRDVITYLPGTGTDMGSFYRGGPQQVSSYLVQADRSGGTVAFVYKDGPWSSWPWESLGQANTNMDFALKEGRQLADFQSAVATEPHLAGARTTGIAHSAGMSILSGSEVTGAHYDKELSLGGAMLAPGWASDPSTDYYHYQYGIDAINYANPIGNLPVESGAFDQRILDPEVHSFLGIPYQNEFDNHGRIAEGVARNQVALQSMYRDIHSE